MSWLKCWGKDCMEMFPWCSNVSYKLNSRKNRSMSKTTIWPVRPAQTKISLGICPVLSEFTVRMKKPWVLSYPLSAQRRLWSDWRMICVFTGLFCWFCLAVAQITKRIQSNWGNSYKNWIPSKKQSYLKFFASYLPGFTLSLCQSESLEITHLKSQWITHKLSKAKGAFC